MRKSGVCYLISQGAMTGVREKSQTAQRKVFCEAMSVTRQEFWMANGQRLRPDLVLKLADMAEFKNEQELLYEGLVYTVVRTYWTPDGGVELTVQRSDSR